MRGNRAIWFLARAPHGMSHGRTSVSRDFGRVADRAATRASGPAWRLLGVSLPALPSRSVAHRLPCCRENSAEKNQREEERSREEVCCQQEMRSPFDVAGRSMRAIPDLRCEGKKHLPLRRERDEKGFQ